VVTAGGVFVVVGTEHANDTRGHGPVLGLSTDLTLETVL